MPYLVAYSGQSIACLTRNSGESLSYLTANSVYIIPYLMANTLVSKVIFDSKLWPYLTANAQINTNEAVSLSGSLLFFPCKMILRKFSSSS